MQPMGVSEIQQIQILKDVTGIGIADCKRALSECNGDISLALRQLLKPHREKMLELAEDERTPTWVLESLALSKIDEVVYLVSKNPTTPKGIKNEAKQESTTYSNIQNVADHDRQIAELRREIMQIKKAYNSLLQSLESRDKEIYDLLREVNKNLNRSSRPANYVTFSLGDF